MKTVTSDRENDAITRSEQNLKELRRWLEAQEVAKDEHLQEYFGRLGELAVVV